MAQNITCSPWWETKGPWLNYYYLVSFDCFPLFLHFLTFLIKLIVWLKFFHRQNAGWGTCSISILPFLWYSSILRKDRYRTRKGIKFRIERLIINLAEELSFSSISFSVFPNSWGNGAGVMTALATSCWSGAQSWLILGLDTKLEIISGSKLIINILYYENITSLFDFVIVPGHLIISRHITMRIIIKMQLCIIL